MTNKDLFYQRIEIEYDDYLDRIDGYNTDELYQEAEKISDMKEIHTYLMRDKPIDGEMLEHYLKLKTPLETICKYYEENKPPIHDRVNHAIWAIHENKVLDYKKNTESETLKEIMRKEFSSDGALYGDESKIYAAESLIKSIMDDDNLFDEYDSKVLLQFKKPFYVLLDHYNDSNVLTLNDQYSDIMECIMSMDLMTSKYALHKDKILPETKFRHEIINKIVDIVPEPDYTATSKWLEFLRDIQINPCEDYDQSENPYEDFGRALESIAYHYSDQIVQTVYNLAKENHMILANEMVGAADYLSSGGQPSDIYRMASAGEFDQYNIGGEEQGDIELC